MRIGIWRTTVVLPIMSVNTLGFIVLGEVKRAEHSFVVKHIKIFVLFEIVNQVGLNLFLRMSE